MPGAMPEILRCSATEAIAGGWDASLALGLERRGYRTVLARARHQGPLRVQRPFHPEGMEVPHLYLLHPPGGLVPGDALDIDITLGAGSRALVTTPASGKVYGVGIRALPQRQVVTARVAAGGQFEWLPQDTIVFDGADAALTSRFRLEGDARLIAWEVITLGRQAGDIPFRRGRVRQELEVWRNGRALLLERLTAEGGSPLLKAPWGLGGHPVFGTMVAAGPIDTPTLEALRALGEEAPECRWSATALPEVTVLRYLGADARTALTCFTLAWTLLRPLLLGRAAVVPRVWAT